MGERMKFRQKGFSLVEVVVGLGIGMISMVVIMQVFAVFEGEKRTTTSGADAQNDGAIALFLIEQDAKMAGWGMDAKVYSGCDNTFSYCDGSAACGGVAGPLPAMNFASLTLKDGGTGPDTMSAHYFTNPEESGFSLPHNTTVQKTMPPTSSELDVERVTGCEAGDLLLVSQTGNCTVMQVTKVQETVKRFQHNPGANGPFNPPASYQRENGWPGYTVGAKVACFKPPPMGALYHHSYSIDPVTRQLVRTYPGGREVVATGMMDLQIQYGVAPAGGSKAVDDWVDAQGDTWENPTLEDVKRIKAIRIALVVRSAQYERPKEGVCAVTTEEMVRKWSSWAQFNIASYGDDWQCYRYKVFETVVPLRNVPWEKL